MNVRKQIFVCINAYTCLWRACVRACVHAFMTYTGKSKHGIHTYMYAHESHANLSRIGGGNAAERATTAEGAASYSALVLSAHLWPSDSRPAGTCAHSRAA